MEGNATNLSFAVLFKVLLLDGGAEVKSGVVDEIGGVLRHIQHHEIDAQSHSTESKSKSKVKFQPTHQNLETHFE